MSEDTDNLIEVDKREYLDNVADAYARGKADGLSIAAHAERRFTAACAAMQGVLSRTGAFDLSEVAAEAVAHADALLAELQKSGDK